MLKITLYELHENNNSYIGNIPIDYKILQIMKVILKGN